MNSRIIHSRSAVRSQTLMRNAALDGVIGGLLGLLLLNTDAHDKAVPELEIASRGMPRDPKVFWALSSAYQQAGRPQDAAKARAEFARLKQLDEKQTQSAEGSESQGIVINVADGSGATP